MLLDERPESAHPRHCRAFRRGSVHDLICRPWDSFVVCKRRLVEFSTYALASHLSASWIKAKVPRVSTRFSKSLARGRVRPNQDKVRSTTQQRGRTTKRFIVARLDDLMCSGGILPLQRDSDRRCSRHRPRSVRATETRGRIWLRSSLICLAVLGSGQSAAINDWGGVSRNPPMSRSTDGPQRAQSRELKFR
jgi:hypothetical protein